MLADKEKTKKKWGNYSSLHYITDTVLCKLLGNAAVGWWSYPVMSCDHHSLTGIYNDLVGCFNCVVSVSLQMYLTLDCFQPSRHNLTFGDISQIGSNLFKQKLLQLYEPKGYVQFTKTMSMFNEHAFMLITGNICSNGQQTIKKTWKLNVSISIVRPHLHCFD